MRISLEFGTNSPVASTLTDTSWRRLRQMIKRRDKSICYHCGEESENGQADHLIPLSRGGTDDPDNLVWSCADCNLKKGDKMPLLNNESGVSKYPQFGRLFSGLMAEVVKRIIPPYPEFPFTLDPNDESYDGELDRLYRLDKELKSQKIRDWIRRRLWGESPFGALRYDDDVFDDL